jgi:hypothetical protein
MKKTAFYILCFITGFFGAALITDHNNPDLLYKKAVFSCCALLIAGVLLLINKFKK